MTGFPTRPNRNAFGPTFVNERPVANPQKEASADLVNLLCWQTGGMGQVSPRVVITGTVSGGSVTTVYQGLAFDPDGIVSTISFGYAEAGRYTFEFTQTYEDENGNARNLDLAAGVATPMNSSSFGVGVVNLTNGYSGEIRFFDAAGLLTDPDAFILQLW
ncbi:MAG: hypothetical protein GY854_02190 [Deltaproteobacteria bacterium]|nr:hypothetical protein [Deltaproteobacteria bacterium]